MYNKQSPLYEETVILTINQSLQPYLISWLCPRRPRLCCHQGENVWVCGLDAMVFCVCVKVHGLWPMILVKAMLTSLVCDAALGQVDIQGLCKDAPSLTWLRFSTPLLGSIGEFDHIMWAWVSLCWGYECWRERTVRLTNSAINRFEIQISPFQSLLYPGTTGVHERAGPPEPKL